MKILEVKNNLVKISYTAQDNLILSGFVIIEDSKSPYVAQVMSLKADSGLNYAIVKLLFTFNNEGVVKNYNGTIPELTANITRLSSDELLDILPIENPLLIGKLAQQNFVLKVDYSLLEKNLLICSDKTENTDILLSNLAKQITENKDKSVIFDIDGTINAENKLVFGRDFKLPLNYDTINFIYENDLNDVDAETKAVIQDIFLEVQEYSKTVLDHFIPFDNFISVVDAQYRELNLPELALLKNRLLKYKEEEVFAQDAKEIQALRAAVRGNLSTLLDISRVDSLLQKQIMSYVYDEINEIGLFAYSIVKINSENADKKLIRKFYSQDKINTIIACPHTYKYLFELKDRASNMIFFAPQTLQHDFASYNIYLNKLNEGECIIYGKATQNIPLIVEIEPLEDIKAFLQEQENQVVTTVEATVEQEKENKPEPQDDFSDESNSYSYESMMEDTAPVSAENLPKNSEVAEVQANDTTLEEIPSVEPEPLVDLPKLDEPELPPMDDEVDENFTEGEVESNVENYDNDLMETADFENEELTLPEEAEEEILPENNEEIEEEPEAPSLSEEMEDDSFQDLEDGVQDVALPEIDEIVEDEQPEDEQELEDGSDESAEDVEENLTEDDLDYIQDVNIQADNSNELGQNAEEGGQPPVVPIYPAEEMTQAHDAPTFEPGDRVSHPKYGEGIVEKMIKYGNKILCSINFESSRRLLDPTISDLKKL